jgi:chemotaxis protein MotB
MDDDWDRHRTDGTAPRGDGTDAGGGGGGPAGRAATPTIAWMVTFSDLTLLLLTFFVLLFAMSAPRSEAWRSFVDGVSTRFDVLIERPTTETSPDGAAEAVVAPPAEDLRYLEGLLAEARRTAPDLAAIDVLAGGDRLVLALPAEAFDDDDDAGGLAVTALGRPLVAALATFLDRLDNRIAVAVVKAPADGQGPSARRATWERALADAEAVATALRQAGYPRPIEGFAQAEPSLTLAGRAATKVPAERPVSIVVLPERRP